MFRLNLLAFIIAFSFGIAYCYVSTPPSKVVVKFPSPNNAGKIVYRDNADNCFAFDANEVQCTKEAIPQPIYVEEDFRGRGRTDRSRQAPRL
jgi:hypothetical protein